MDKERKKRWKEEQLKWHKDQQRLLLEQALNAPPDTTSGRSAEEKQNEVSMLSALVEIDDTEAETEILEALWEQTFEEPAKVAPKVIPPPPAPGKAAAPVPLQVIPPPPSPGRGSGRGRGKARED